MDRLYCPSCDVAFFTSAAYQMARYGARCQVCGTALVDQDRLLAEDEGLLVLDEKLPVVEEIDRP